MRLKNKPYKMLIVEVFKSLTINIFLIFQVNFLNKDQMKVQPKILFSIKKRKYKVKFEIV